MLRKYWTIFSISLTDRLTYRTDFFVSTIMRFLPMVTTIFLWGAVFAGSKNSSIAGFTADEMIAYYLLSMVGRAFSSMPGLADGISRDIRQGDVKKYLIQPVDLIGFLLASRTAHKLVYYTFAALPFAGMFYLCRGYFTGWPPPAVLATFFLSLVLSFLIGFLFESLVGLCAFWILEIGSFNMIMITLTYVLSGHMFPLDLIPGWIGQFLMWLPFQYLAYFPAKVFIHGARMTGSELAGALLFQFAYVIGLWFLVRWTLHRGLKQYGAYGG